MTYFLSLQLSVFIFLINFAMLLHVYNQYVNLSFKNAFVFDESNMHGKIIGFFLKLFDSLLS